MKPFSSHLSILPEFTDQMNDLFDTYLQQFDHSDRTRPDWTTLSQQRQDRLRSEFAWHHGFYSGSPHTPSLDEDTANFRNLDFFQNVHKPLLPEPKRLSFPYMTFAREEEEPEESLDPRPLLGLSRDRLTPEALPSLPASLPVNPPTPPNSFQTRL